MADWTCIRVTRDLRDRVKERAREERRPIIRVLEAAVEAYLAEKSVDR